MVIASFNKRSLMLFALALSLQAIFMIETFLHKKETLLFQDPGLVGAYNVAMFSTPHIQEDIVRSGYRVQGNGQLLSPAKMHKIQDTIGYPVLLGLLWKVTNTFSLYDIIIFQMFVFSVLLVFFDQALVLILNNRSLALSGTLGLVFFLPFIFFNVQPVKDVYLLYGILIFFIAIANYFFGNGNHRHVALWALLFSLCQWIRSPLFGTLCMMTVMLLLFFSLFDQDKKKVIRFLGIFWLINTVIFWIPFIRFNKITYGRYFVGCSGQAILEGIGEFNNKWNFKLSDAWYEHYIGLQEPSLAGKYGTLEFDDVAKRIALNALKEDPFILIRNIIKRIPQILYYPLPCFSYFLNYNIFSERPPSIKDRARAIFTDLGFFKSTLFLISRFWASVTIFLGYLGLIVLFKKKKYAFLVLWISAYIGSLGLILSHIELRYIYPVMPLWGVLAGMFCYDAYLWIRKKWFASVV